VDPVPDPLLFFSGSAGSRTRASGSVAKNSDHLTTEAVTTTTTTTNNNNNYYYYYRAIMIIMARVIYFTALPVAGICSLE
jgi:hypothetical protein